MAHKPQRIKVLPINGCHPKIHGYNANAFKTCHVHPARYRADFRFAPSQWETPLQSYATSQWLSANLESALEIQLDNVLTFQVCPKTQALQILLKFGCFLWPSITQFCPYPFRSLHWLIDIFNIKPTNTPMPGKQCLRHKWTQHMDIRSRNAYIKNTIKQTRTI